MLQRVKELETKVATLVTDVAIIKDKLASKEDIQSVKTELHKELNAQNMENHYSSSHNCAYSCLF
ncbi:Uncharacterised protein [Enterobacter asburiae]|uniref:Uncharacterized protein n=1 Tax=Enterobacter asburiae TaxID=61645 RepID=A0A376F9L8_ENTAS|nr:Uncharacterised protein [Enterobacter asburiae]